MLCRNKIRLSRSGVILFLLRHKIFEAAEKTRSEGADDPITGKNCIAILYKLGYVHFMLSQTVIGLLSKEVSGIRR